MQEREASMLIEAGVIDSAVIYRARNEQGEFGPWELHLYGFDGVAMPSGLKNALEKARGGVRLFATLDAAWGALERLRPDARRLRVSIDG
jgi:hypothetical protein